MFKKCLNYGLHAGNNLNLIWKPHLPFAFRSSYIFCRSKVELVLSYGSQFFELIFIYSGSEFLGLSFWVWVYLGLTFYSNSERVRKKWPWFKKGILGKSLTSFLLYLFNFSSQSKNTQWKSSLFPQNTIKTTKK